MRAVYDRLAVAVLPTTARLWADTGKPPVEPLVAAAFRQLDMQRLYDGVERFKRLHGSKFDLRTGKPTGLPATEPVATFPVDVRGTDVYVDVEQSLNGVTPQ